MPGKDIFKRVFVYICIVMVCILHVQERELRMQEITAPPRHPPNLCGPACRPCVAQVIGNFTFDVAYVDAVVLDDRICLRKLRDNEVRGPSGGIEKCVEQKGATSALDAIGRGRRAGGKEERGMRGGEAT